MTNQNAAAIKYDKLYNPSFKKQFIENYDNAGSQFTIYSQLKAISVTEFFLNKDLYDMTFNEVKGAIQAAECSSPLSAANMFHVCRRYKQFAVDKGIINNFDSLFILEKEGVHNLAMEVVATYKNRQYSYEQIMEMVDLLQNDTDKAVILALFEGIKGTYYSELLTLKSNNIEPATESDLNLSYKVKVYDSKKQQHRFVDISELTKKTLLKADSQTEYYTNSLDGNSKNTAFRDSEFIFKKGTRGKEQGALDRYFLVRKFLYFKELFGNPHLTAEDIITSGMMYYTNKLYKEKGEVGKDELLIIAEKYNTPYATADGKFHYRNLTILRRNIFSPEFKRLYGEIEYKG